MRDSQPTWFSQAILLLARVRLASRNQFIAIGHFQFFRSLVMEIAKRVNIPVVIPCIRLLDERPDQVFCHTPNGQAKGGLLAA